MCNLSFVEISVLKTVDIARMNAVLDLISTNISLIATFVVSLWFVFVYLPKKPKNFPPGPTGLPILGVALSIGTRPEITFRKWAEKYGDVIGFKVGSNYTVVLNSYEKIQEALVKYGSAFGSRPNNILFTEGLRKSGLSGSDYSQDFMTQRNFAHGVLGKLGFGKSAMEVPVLDEALRLVASLGDGKVPLDDAAKIKIQFASANILAQVTTGKRFPDLTDEEFLATRNGWTDFFHLGAPAFTAALISPSLLYLPQLRQSATYVRTSLHKHEEFIRQRVKEHKEMLDPANPKDFIDEFLIEQRNNGTKHLYTDEMLVLMVRDLFGGGLETTELTMIFSCLMLANRPHIRKKIHQEIDEVLGPNGKVRYTHKEEMTYCHAVIKEVMRCRSVGPLLVPHCVHENVKFKGYEIPKDSTILANVHAVHFSPKYWDKPEEFNPERFIDEDGKVITTKYLIPFGIGPRQCIGRRLAELEVFFFFVTLFQKFDVIPTPQPGCERPWVFDDVYRTGLAVNAPDDTPVTLVSRRG